MASCRSRKPEATPDPGVSGEAYLPVERNVGVAVSNCGWEPGEPLAVEFFFLDFLEAFLPVVVSSFSFQQHFAGWVVGQTSLAGNQRGAWNIEKLKNKRG